ncbi:thermonuclease family protein [Pedobacter cryotolerans]|nr:thermonuclease family protein [Pedobacter cryotolerans]
MIKKVKFVSPILFLFIGISCSQNTTQPIILTTFEQQTFVAKVIRIIDGDTMEVLYEETPIKIRLAHIDCPEKRGKQPFGNQAKIALSDLCFGQNVTIYGENYDRYNRLIAVIVNENKQQVNQELVKQGMAWHFKKYSTNQTYHQLELEARKSRIGLWKDANPIAPWKWRKNNTL